MAKPREPESQRAKLRKGSHKTLSMKLGYWATEAKDELRSLHL